jgi:hypothetical protein
MKAAPLRRLLLQKYWGTTRGIGRWVGAGKVSELTPAGCCVFQREHSNSRQAVVYLVHLQPNGVLGFVCVLPPGADVAMSHQCQLMPVATANKGPARRDSHHGQATARMLCLHGTMAACRRCWKEMALDGSADDERASDGGLLGVRSARQRDDDVLERARACEAFSWPGGFLPAPLGRFFVIETAAARPRRLDRWPTFSSSPQPSSSRLRQS